MQFGLISFGDLYDTDFSAGVSFDYHVAKKIPDHCHSVQDPDFVLGPDGTFFVQIMLSVEGFTAAQIAAIIPPWVGKVIEGDVTDWDVNLAFC